MTSRHVHLRTYKIISFFLSVTIGLVMAFVFVDGVNTLFPTISADALSDAPRTPADPFVIRFSSDIGNRAALGNVALLPARPFRTEWSDARTLVVSPEDRWDAGAGYRFSFSGGRDGWFRSVLPESFTFSVPGYPSVASFIPVSGDDDVLLDIEDPIVVTFDRPVGDFYVDFRLSPGMEVTYENDTGKRSFRILPKGTVEPGTEYVLSVYAKWRDEADDGFRFLGETRFTTLALRPAEWSDDPSLRAEQAKRYAKAVIPTGKYIDIDVSNQVMILFEDGRPVDAYPVSSGKPGMDTPKGTFAIRNKTPRAWSSAYGLYMPYWMAIVPDGKFGIHELPEWPGGYKEGANHLGIPVSHGCVRLGVGPAERVYGWADIGTPVVVR